MLERRQFDQLSPEEAEQKESMIFAQLLERYMDEDWGSTKWLALEDHKSDVELTINLQKHPDDISDTVRHAIVSERINQRLQGSKEYFEEFGFLEFVTLDLKELHKRQNKDSLQINDFFSDLQTQLYTLKDFVDYDRLDY